jgi:hypothetical protein
LENINFNNDFLYNYGIKQDIYTPTELERSDKLKNDQPYAGHLELYGGISKLKSNSIFSIEIGIGTTGENSFAEDVQNGIHEILPTTKKKINGWKYQIGNCITGRISLSNKYRKSIIKNNLDIIYSYGGNLSNFISNIYINTQLRLGFNLPKTFGLYSNLENTLNYNGIIHKNNFYLTAGTKLEYIFNDITLKGLDIVNFKKTYFTGVSTTLYDVTASVLLNIETKRFEKQNSNSFKYASFTLSYKF